ncbi:hypothetical protein T02_7432 [Trichinella nativa]|uniref:Uncharacterized protein n=1 Tax=Trichinella nativa TaxID=6335 RepID=A0A0V1KJR0_9BILA|nr:hypothetical protein T02_7432 [Trichinella nativa]
MNVKRQRVGCIVNSLSFYCGPLRFMNMVSWPLSEMIAFPIASHELLKGILVQRENEQMTNCPQLQ